VSIKESHTTRFVKMLDPKKEELRFEVKFLPTRFFFFIRKKKNLKKEGVVWRSP
jgi:hypothetical protein